MKHLAFGLVIIMGLSSGCWAISEEELLKLPLDKLWEGIQSTASPDLKKQFVDAYNLRMMKLKVGEDRWDIYQQFRVIKARGFGGLVAFFNETDYVSGSCFEREYGLINNRAKDAPEQREAFIKEYKALKGDFDKFHQFTKDVIAPDLLYLAPSSAAKKLDQMAGMEAKKIAKKSENANYNAVFTKEDVDRNNLLIENYLQKIKAMPKLTKEQVESEFKALPPEFPTR